MQGGLDVGQALNYILALLQNGHISLLLTIEFLVIALGIALSEWSHGENADARRLSFVLGTLLLLRLLLLWEEAHPFAPLEPVAEAVSLILLAWVFSRSLFENPSTADKVRNLALGGVFAGAVPVAWLWQRNGGVVGPAPPSSDWFLVVWHLALAGMAGLTTWLMGWRRREQCASLELLFALLTVGHAGVVIGFPQVLPACNAFAYPILALATFQSITADLHAYGSELRSLSERSLDRTKERVLLLEMSRAARSELEPSALLKLLTDYSAPVFDVDGLAVLIAEGDRAQRAWKIAARYLTLPAGEGDSPQTHLYLDGVTPLNAYIEEKRAGSCDLEGQNGAFARARDIIRELFGIEHPGPLYLQPIIVNEMAVGAIIGARRAGRPHFSEDDAQVFEAVGSLMAMMLEQLRLSSHLRTVNEDLVALNKQLIAAYDQLQEMDRLKSAFLSVITHELRTPFAGVDLSLEVLKREGLDGFSEEQRRQLAQLEEGLWQARHKVDQLVSFAGLLSRQGELSLKPVDMLGLVQDVVHMLHPMAEARRVWMEVESSGSPQVVGDAERLAETVQHLVHNAIKFNQDGGSVRVRLYEEGNEVVCEVSDTGRGIPPEQLEGIWDPFSQGADPVRRGVEGLGLGLAAVKLIVDAHHGTIVAESAPAHGSRFVLRLPRSGPGETQ